MPPTTATRMTGERPDGVGATIQREVDEGRPTWLKNQLFQQRKLHQGLNRPTPEKAPQEVFFPGSHEGAVLPSVRISGQGITDPQHLPLPV
jgi:hypothetical protein